MAGETYGYARVSSQDQSLSRQLDALHEFGIADARVYADKASGKDFERPAWTRLVRRLKRGDVLVIKSIDRLGRSYREILEEWRRLTKGRGVSVVVLDMPLLDTRAKPEGVTGELVADLVLQLLSYVAQVEREAIRQRQAEGIAAAKARGVRFGRPQIKKPASWPEVRDRYAAGELTRAQAARELGVGVSTFDSWRRQG